VRISGVEKCSDSFLTEALAYLDAPQDGATVVLRHTGASVRGKKLLDAIRAGQGAVSRSLAPRSSGFRSLRLRRGRVPVGAPEDRTLALRGLVGAFADDLTELAAACQQLIADVPGDITEQIVERYYGGRVETSAFTVADTAIAGGTAMRSSRCVTLSRAEPTRFPWSPRSPPSCARWLVSPAAVSPRAPRRRGSA
jgi:DNA polymerase-3 subunit delta